MSLNTILFITSFVPVAVFKIIARVGDANLAQAKFATVVGLVLAIIQFVLAKKYIKHTSYLERAFLVYLAAGAAWVHLMPDNVTYVFVDNSIAILYFVLFLTTFIPQLLGYDPFTYMFARQWYPEAVWNTPQFKVVNLHITYVFSGIFFMAFLSSWIGHGKPLFSIVIPFALIIGIGLPFSRKYPVYYVKKNYPSKPIYVSAIPQTARELIARMPSSFDADAASDLIADIQFRISGEEEFNMVISIANGKCIAREGEVNSPALTIIAPADVWMKMARSEINKARALMDGLYKVEGDINLLIKMGQIFQTSAKASR
ncbi:MAG: SCP2 sterol-binding domain-containing protein [Syntrophales bacterium]